jgi:hypothetical protein
MKKFELTVVTEKRLNVAFIATIIFVIGGVLLLMLFEILFWKITVPILFIAVTVIPTIYSTYCRLTINIIDNKLHFKWKEKIAFNFKPIKEIDLKDIHTLVIDRDIDVEILNGIRTDKEEVHLRTLKYWRKDTDHFIQYLKDNTNAKIGSRWDKLKSTGYTRTMYLFTTISLVIATGFLVWIIAVHGLEKFENISASKWFILIFCVVGLIAQRKFFKNKLK